MPRPCSICVHQSRRKIEEANLSGDPLRNIAQRFKVSTTALHRHKKSHLTRKLSRAIQRRQELEEDSTLEFALAKLEERLRQQQDRYDRMQQLIKARREEMAGEVPGGASGLFARKQKRIGSGKSVKTVWEYSVDHRLLKEIRELEKQVALESGEFGSKGSVATSGPTFVTIRPEPKVTQREIPVAQPLEYWEGSPPGVVDADFEDVPALGLSPAKGEEGSGADEATENPGRAPTRVIRIADIKRSEEDRGSI